MIEIKTISDLKNIVLNEITEDLNLEYKRSDSILRLGNEKIFILSNIAIV